MSDLVPRHGARVLLERASVDDAGAIYRVAIHAPSSSWSAEARIVVEGGRVELGPWTVSRGQSAAPEPWMVESARGFLRTLLKNHAEDRGWPSRQLRWRDRR